MQFFRNISKSKIVIAATAMFAVVMLVTSLERSIIAPLRAQDKNTNSQVIAKLNNVISNHIQQYGSEPSEQQIMTYHQHVLKAVQSQGIFSSFFKKLNFQVSTKQLLRFAQKGEHTKSLIDKIVSPDASDRKQVPAQLEEMKSYAEQAVFESAIASSTIATEDHIDRLRNVFMQERTYQWLKVTASYIDPKSLSVDNEAEIQQYYQTHDFPVPASASIQFIEIAPSNVPSARISTQAMLSRIQSGQSETPSQYTFKTHVYALEASGKQPIPDPHKDQVSPLLNTIPQKYQSGSDVFYKKHTLRTLSEHQASAAKLDQLSENRCIFDNSLGADSVICLDKVISKPCKTSACIQQATTKWNHQLKLNAVNAKLASIQNDKLFTPKDLASIAQKHHLKLQKSHNIIADSSDISSGNALNRAVFKSVTPETALNTIRGPVKIGDDRYAFYQINAYNAESKQPLHDVRGRIIDVLHQQQMTQKLTNDCEQSVKQLHNGESITVLADKFKSRLLSSDQKIAPSDQLPDSVLQSAQQIPSLRTGWTNPILKYHPESKSWYLLSLSKVVYTDKNTSSVDHIVNDETITRLIQRRELNAMHQAILSSD